MKKNKKITRRRNNKRKKTTKSKYLNSRGGSGLQIIPVAEAQKTRAVARLSDFPDDLGELDIDRIDTLMMDDMLPISDTSDTSDKNSLIMFKDFYEKKKDNHIDSEFIKYIKQKNNIS